MYQYSALSTEKKDILHAMHNSEILVKIVSVSSCIACETDANCVCVLNALQFFIYFTAFILCSYKRNKYLLQSILSAPRSQLLKICLAIYCCRTAPDIHIVFVERGLPVDLLHIFYMSPRIFIDNLAFGSSCFVDIAANSPFNAHCNFYSSHSFFHWSSS